MTTTAAAPLGARAVADVWRALARTADGPELFDPAAAAGLPEPARRWVAHAIAPGTPLWRAVVLQMHGHIRLGTWRAFRAREVLAPGAGYVWAATARVAGLPVVGYDRYSGGTAELRWRLCGLLPVMSADGDDVALSAAGRLVGESVVVPTAFRSAGWAGGSRPDTVTASWTVDGRPETVELHVDRGGALRSVVMHRWGNPLGEPYGRYPFGVDLADEATFDGITIPTSLRAAWFWGTPRAADGAFFRARITGATWR